MAPECPARGVSGSGDGDGLVRGRDDVEGVARGGAVLEHLLGGVSMKGLSDSDHCCQKSEGNWQNRVQEKVLICGEDISDSESTPVGGQERRQPFRGVGIMVMNTDVI